jgi:hypothetical protein
VHTTASIRATLENVFSCRHIDALLHLLGFPDPPVRVDGCDEDVWYHGSRGTLACYVIRGTGAVARLARSLRDRNIAQLQLYVFTRDDCQEIVIASFGLGERLLALTLSAGRIHASDLETLQELIPQSDERGSALAARHARALDRARITHRFFADFAAQRDLVASAWCGPAPQQRRDREQLALLLLSRLMFLYFLQHRGYLAGDRAYLVRRFREWTARRRTFYAGALKPLFFFVLNRRAAQRPAQVASFGDLPYLNGGLFERHTLERKYARLDLPDATMRSIFDDLLERYRFTAREASDAEIAGVHDVGVDPEMLGGVFEGLMAARVRETTGTFYTPAATVDRLVCNTLDAYVQPLAAKSRALREVKVLDPACGSGAFLLGVLGRIAERRAADGSIDVMVARREIVARSLYGVDLQSDAALLCALRLWLALVPGSDAQPVQPLPNLDRRIRQGDSLIDPLDLRVGIASAEVRHCINDLEPASLAYVDSEPELRPSLQRSLLATERRLARAWIRAQLKRITYQTAELRAAAAQKDLFGAITPEARAARYSLVDARSRTADLKRIARDMRAKNERPFFSFPVHFPDAALHGFDIVLCNPPWVRSHNWPRSIGAIARRRFQVCRTNGGPGGNQIDLALLFLERALQLLAPGGALGIILPAKFMRSLSGAAARRLLLEQTDIISIEDHSLDQRSIFHADAFAALIVARRKSPDSPSPAALQATMIRRGATASTFSFAQSQLPFDQRDARSPWLIVPPDVRRAIATMAQAPCIARHGDLHIRRGLVSGANRVMLLARVEPKLSGLAEIRSEGFESATRRELFEGVVEAGAIARVVRGCDVGPWQCRQERWLLCKPAATSNLPRLANYLRKHGRDLSDVPKVGAIGTAVAWHDLASNLNAVVLPANVVAINTVYFIPLPIDDAHVLCAVLNSLPVRTFARAIAERAKDAHFRFFAWTMAMLPLPAAWRGSSERLRQISLAAHDAGCIDSAAQQELDTIVARMYGLGSAELRALAGFDRWLRGA